MVNKYIHIPKIMDSVGTYLSTKPAIESEPNVAQGERDIFVEKIPQKLTHSVV